MNSRWILKLLKSFANSFSDAWIDVPKKPASQKYYMVQLVRFPEISLKLIIIQLNFLGFSPELQKIPDDGRNSLHLEKCS